MNYRTYVALVVGSFAAACSPLTDSSSPTAETEALPASAAIVDPSVTGPLRSLSIKYKNSAPFARTASSNGVGVRSVTDWPKHRWLTMDVQEARVDATVRRLRALPWVEQVVLGEDNSHIFGKLHRATNFVTARRTDTKPWGVDSTDADYVQGIGYSGSGVKVGVLDTGVECTHDDLEDRLAGGHDYVHLQSGAACNDQVGHGTGVAGIALATANGSGVIGMAPSASLYSVQVCDSAGDCSDTRSANGINWAISNGMDVINLSYGNCGSALTGAVLDAVEDAVTAGIIVVAATGNGNDSGCNSSNPVSGYAQVTGVIGVGGNTENGSYVSSNQHGTGLDLSAPTVVLTSALGNSTQTLDGSSAAAPHVTGAVALLVSAGWTGSNVYTRLTSSARDRGASGLDGYYGYGFIDALAAVVPGPQITDVTACYTPPLHASSCLLSPQRQWGLQTLEYRWEVSYTDGAHSSIDTGYGTDSTYNLPVPSGEYTITVVTTIREKSGYSPRNRTSISDSRQYPVCPGGDDLRASLRSDGGGAHLDAICP